MQKTTKNLALTGIIAALYTTITLVLQPISFLSVQVRVSGALIFLLPLFPIPVLVGVSIGVFLSNIGSPLGAIDLVSAAITFGLMVPLYLAREKHDVVKILAAACKSLGIGVWVAFALQVSFGVPFGLTWYWIVIGDLIAVIGLGYPLFKGVKKVASSSGLLPCK